MTRMLMAAVVLTVVLTGCAKDRSSMRTLPDAQVHETPCSDAQLESICTSPESTRPVRVDTNLHSQRTLESLAG